MNKYDDPMFFNKYKEMARSQEGLTAAGEWSNLKTMLPDFQGKRVLDIGCGYGWLCMYAIEQGASSVVGIDSSHKMLQVAEEKKKAMVDGDKIVYKHMTIEDMVFAEQSFDVVLSSLALHYTASFEDVMDKIARYLCKGGDVVLSVEHPIFTAYGTGDWIYNNDGQPDHWPVDLYFEQGPRHTQFLGCSVIKYHKTLTTYVNGLIRDGRFQLTKLIEPLPEQEMLASMPDEARRPMMLLMAAKRI
ncbi:methylase [Halteromyces radiatus]|uniref:methylase n=1 Tax=Halteromyces radiatus TaxID=101107 RepID=UPI00221F6F99|nr:methylase [Halteromyces radiatus]KAI8079814.1 methylase [Halteromyces radiatus]